MTRFVNSGRYLIQACIVLAPGGLLVIIAYHLIRHLRQKRLQAEAALPERP